MAIIIQCPFYKKNKEMKTYCEGGSVTHPDREARRAYLSEYCTDINCWHKCTIAAAMEKYYERKHDDE